MPTCRAFSCPLLICAPARSQVRKTKAQRVLTELPDYYLIGSNKAGVTLPSGSHSRALWIFLFFYKTQPHSCNLMQVKSRGQAQDWRPKAWGHSTSDPFQTLQRKGNRNKCPEAPSPHSENKPTSLSEFPSVTALWALTLLVKGLCSQSDSRKKGGKPRISIIHRHHV